MSELLYVNGDLHNPMFMPDQLDDCWLHIHGNTLKFKVMNYRRYVKYLGWVFLGADPHEIRNDPAGYYGKPFVEQVGSACYATTIGPQSSTKLLRDYTSRRSQFRDCISNLDLCGMDWGLMTGSEDAIRKDLMETYDNWIRAFAIASETGVVYTQYRKQY